MLEQNKTKNSCAFPFGDEGYEMLKGMSFHHSDITKMTLDLLKPAIDDTILEIGSGFGHAINAVSKIAKNGTLHAIDYSEMSVKCTTENNQDDVNSKKLTVHHGSVSNLPFSDNTFDKIYSIESYFFWPEIEKDAKEILRVLKPGGKAFIAEHVMDDDFLSNMDDEQKERCGNLRVLAHDDFVAIMKEAGFKSAKSYVEGENDCCHVLIAEK